MKTITDDFIAAQKKANANVVREVYYKKRYWDQATNAYIWESSWTQIGENEISSISPVAWNLDTETVNEFKVSNVTIELKNFDNKWRPDNNAGFFKPDSTSLIGYESYWTKFKIDIGYEIADGTDELITIFTGLLTEQTFWDDGRVQIRIEGLEAILKNTKAEGIATTVDSENAGTGDDAEDEFTTTNNGVGGITEVSLDGIAQVQEDDYSISDLNLPGAPGKVTFNTPPTPGQVIGISYFYWTQNQEFDELISNLLDEAGIPSGDQNIDPVSFPNNILNSNVYTTQAEWDAGTKTTLDTTRIPGAIFIDLQHADNRNATNWSTIDTGWTLDNFATDGTYQVTSSGASAYRAMASTHGFFSYDLTIPTVLFLQVHFDFWISASGFNGFTFDTGYFLRFDPNALNQSDSHLTLFKVVGGGVPELVGSSVTVDGSAGEVTVTIFRKGNGDFIIKWAGTTVITVTDNTITSGDSIMFMIFETDPAGGPTTDTWKFRNVWVPASTVVATWQSATVNIGAVPKSWGVYTNLDNASAGITGYQTRTGTDGMAWDSWLDITSLGFPTSALQQNVQTRVQFSVSTAGMGDPRTNEIVLRYITSSIQITIADFSGDSVHDAIKKLAVFSNYEFGFNPDETFFFRPKSVGVKVMDLTESDYNAKITGMRSGFDRVYSVVRAVYGAYTKEVTDDGLFPSSPVARLSNKRLTVSPDSRIIIPDSSDIASGVASQFFKSFSQPKRRMRLTTKLLPQLDLSDAVNLTFENNRPSKLWYHGDPDVHLGQNDIHHWGKGTQIVSDMKVKIIGSRYDTEKHKCEFEMEEVI